jgi:signal transduction histidine kinase
VNDELVERTVQLERAQAAAESANRAKSEFLASMSHELRTPLNAIGGYVQLMADGIYGSVTDPQSNALDRVTRAQRHLLGLINDVLNLARVEAGRVEYRIVQVPLSEVVDELAAMIEPQVAAKEQRYTVTIGTPKLTVRADHEKLVQILLNLLSNAVKFTPPGGAITLSATKRDGNVDLVVTDTGRGVPREKLESIFEPFVQVRVDLSKPNEGTGLGLAISRNLARGLGGDLRAASVVGAGSTFTLSMPA